MGMVDIDPIGVTAAGIPVKPPKVWFDDPEFDRLTPLTVDAAGRVSGHIASWDSSHIGRLGKVRPPRSHSNYAYFRTGVVETDTGDMVHVGQITLTGGHAPLEASARDAVRHYDDTASAVMDVSVGEDRHGIWVAGALRPDIDDTKIRAVRASSVSGDWRPIDGALELVAICSVNVPGFPIPRAMAASGDDGEEYILSLVAAGAEPLVLLNHEEPTVAAMRYIIGDIETKVDWMRAAMMALTAAIDDDEDVYEDEDEDDVDEDDVVVASFSDSLDLDSLISDIESATDAGTVWDDGLPLQFTLAQVERIDLRLRMHGGSAVDPDLRREAMVAGAALPNGRLPIQTEEDVAMAIMLVPRGTPDWEHVERRAAALGVDLQQAEQEALMAAARTFTAEKREKMAEKGEAMEDGSFPIADATDLLHAIKAVGRAKDPQKARAHIMKRARALGLVKMLPEKWSD